MIQRIQTLFLAAVVALMTWFCFSPIWEKINDKTAEKIVLTPLSLVYYQAFVEDSSLSNLNVTESNNVYILVVAGMSVLLTLISLFSFKKRVRQMKLGFLNALLIVILFSVTYYQILEADSMLSHPKFGEYKIGFFLPLFAFVFNIVAIYYIKKDEDLVRSADRFR